MHPQRFGDAKKPEIKLIAPTPRAFTFSRASSLSIPLLSPLNSPSSSPFEPDLSPLTTSSCSMFPPSPLSEPNIPCLPSPDVSDEPPTPVPRRGDKDYIKRPENAFMLFRRKCCESNQDTSLKGSRSASRKRPRQADLSKSISQQWRALPPIERQYWEDLAKEKKREHEEMYPGYVYRPQRARDREGNVIPRRPRGTGDKAKAKRTLTSEPAMTQLPAILPPPPPPSLNVVIPSSMRSCGRSMSLPTTRELLEIPNIYGSSPSSSSRASAPGHERKPFSLDDNDIDWTGKNPIPWNMSWTDPISTPELLPSLFPNQNFTFGSHPHMPLELSPSMSSESSFSTLASFDFLIDETSPMLASASSCDPFSGMDLTVDFSSSASSLGSAWEQQASSLWGGSISPLSLNLGLSDGESSAWGISAVPPMELGLPQLEESDATSK